MSTLYLTCMGAICKFNLSLVLTIGAEAKILALLYLGQILMGFGGYSLSMVSYSYLSEINNDVWRQKSLVLTYAFWYCDFYSGRWARSCFTRSFDGSTIGVTSAFMFSLFPSSDSSSCPFSFAKLLSFTSSTKNTMNALNL